MTTLDNIAEVAKHQEGYVATYQVEVSRQMFSHHESQGRLERLLPGIYRLEHFPMAEDEELIVAYLWSRQRGVISHQTALSLHDLSDVLPRAVDITMPVEESLPPQEPPSWVKLHRADVPEEDRQWYRSVPVTTPARTILDLAVDGLNPALFEQALDEALERGLVPQGFERRIIHELMTRPRQ
jgi:predicted transcriptional regulator of viral defense system